MAISTYGPYYESKIQSKEKTKKALTGQGYTPEELAGATYGELMARYKDAEVRRQQETETALREQQLGLYGRQLRGQEKAAKSAERGQAISGIATGINVFDKIFPGTLKAGAKALTGLVSPAVTDVAGAIDYSGLAGGAEDIWTGMDYGYSQELTDWGVSFTDWTTDWGGGWGEDIISWFS